MKTIQIMKRIFILLLVAAAVLTSCEKSFENFTPNTNNPATDTVWGGFSTGNFAEVNSLHQNLVRAPLIDSINLAANTVINFSGDIRIDIPAFSFKQNGTVADGKASIEFFLLKSRGDFIRFRKPTTSNGYLLESGGSFNLLVSKNGQALQLLPGTIIKVSYKDPSPNPLMKGFTGISSITGSATANFNWVKDDSIMVRAVQSGYEVFANTVNWINCDYFRDTAELKTRIAFILPKEFTNTNTSSFIVYKTIRAVMQMDADPVNRIWRKDKVPVNRQVVYVTISKRGDNYYLGTKESNTVINQNVEIRPEKKSLLGIKNFLDSL